MRSWPEFRSGVGYDVDLASTDASEVVSVSIVDTAAEERAYVRVRASVPGVLFERVLGRVTYVLASHSENLVIERIT